MVASVPPRPAGERRSARPRVLVISGSVGAGHDGAARELASRLTAAGADVEVRDFLAAVPGPVARLLREGYTGTVARIPAAFEFFFRRLEHRGVLWGAEQAVCALAAHQVAGWVTGFGPDVVVTTYPPASQTAGRLRADGRLRVPALTYLTDPAVHVSWLHPAVDAHLTVTSATAAHGAAEYGYPFTVAGPLVPARFSVALGARRRADLRTELGLPAGASVALLAAGSLGLGDVLDTTRVVAAAGLTPLVLCGRNEALRRRAGRVPGAVALGWRSDVDQLLQVADVLVQNAGGLSFTEALVAGLPVVTYRPIPGHGRANARVLDAAGLAPWARTPAELAVLLRREAARVRTPAAAGDPAQLVLAQVAGRAPVENAA